MKYAKLGLEKYLIRLVKGEEIAASIKAFCEKNNVKNAWFSAIGSIENPTLAHYRVDTKKYSEKKLQGIFEVVSLIGNVSVFEDKPLVHAHISLSDEDMNGIAGHLVNGIVSATLEVLVTDLGSSYAKSYNDEIGLKLWDLPEEISSKR